MKIYTATDDHDIALHQVHDRDGGRIRYEKRCDVCGQVVPFEHIEKAYQSGDRTVVITDDDLDSLPEASKDDIEVVEFVPSEQVDPIRFERSYFLEPERAGLKPYVLLRQTLERTDRTAIVRFALRQKTHLGALRVRDGVLLLQSLLWGDELRESDFSILDSPPRISPKEQQLADSLVKSLESDFDPDAFQDEYRDELQTLIDAKLEEGDAFDTAATFGEAGEGEEAEGAEVVDLMEALRRSVESGRRTPAKASSATGSGTKPAAKKPAAKKPASGARAKPAKSTAKTSARSKPAPRKRAS